MEHLAAKSLPCPLPVRARDGANLNKLAGRIAAITTFLPGVWPRRPTVAHCGPLGAAMARMHLAGEDYAPTRANALGPQGWSPLLGRCGDSGDAVLPGLTGEVRAALEATLAPGRRRCRAGTSMPTCSPTTCSSSTTRFRG